ncbi:MAG: porin family protein [Rhodothermia bacterium]
MIHKTFSVWLIAAVLLVVPASARAQIQLGAKVGFAVTNFLGDSDPQFQSKANFTGGFTFRHEMTRNHSIQTELLYVVKGSKTQTRINDVPSDLSFTVTYLEVPALLRYSFSPRSGVSPIIAAGPVVSWNIDSRVKWSAVGSDVEFSDSDDSIRGIDLGVAAEAGVDFKWDLRTISAGLRFTYGVSNIIENPDDPKHNGAFAATVGIGL